MYKKRKLKKGAIIGIIVLILIIAAAIGGFGYYKHINSYEYKLAEVGYSETEVAVLLKMDNKVIDKALNSKYNKHLIPLAKEKYFIWKNYKTYNNYINELSKDTNTIDYEMVVRDVNVKRNYDYYTHTEKTDMDKGNAILVNKYHSLPEKYAPQDIVAVSNQHCYGTASIKSEVYEAFKNMFNAAKKEDITLIINSGYRNYEDQKDVYDMYKDTRGEEEADAIAARPDFSEHQTGLALDIITYGASGATFDTTDAFKWLQDNAHKYGFILRYPKDKEDITGYSYESWHYRYVGVDLATKVKKSGLTYDEYYAFYLDKD